MRFLEIITEIKTQPRQLPGTLLEKLEISRSQFYKDRKELQKLGFCFHFDRGGKRYVIDQDRFLPTEDLTLSERLVLIQAIRQLAATGDYGLSFHAFQAARKLLSSLEGSLWKATTILFDDWVLRKGFGCDPAILEQLQQAWAENRRIHMLYQKPQEALPKEYEFDPYSLFFKRRALYVQGYSATNRGIRTFRVNRIRKVEFTGMCFQIREDYDFGKLNRNAFSVFGGESVQKVVVRFSCRVRAYIEESLWHGSLITEPDQDGSILFTVEVTEPREVLWWAFSWGSDAEILEPEWLREEARKEVEKMRQYYESSG
jgi:predicted DNA-binding transcriptional regulator YafY